MTRQIVALYDRADRIVADPTAGWSNELRQLYLETEAIPRRPGYRRDAHGRTFYSSAWLEAWRR